MNKKGMMSCVILLILMTARFSAADIFTSMSEMHSLLHTEGEIIRTLENYISAQESKLRDLKKNIEEMEAIHKKAAKSPDQFLGHPINAFLLVKRLTLDWADMQNSITQDSTGQAIVNNLTHYVLKWPNEEDLTGVATALMRLQDTYQLDTAQMAQGYINDLPPAYRELTASDCFELGRQSYNSGDHYHTVLWMTEALERLQQPTPPHLTSKIERADVLEYLAFSNYMQGHVKHALRLTDELLELRPDHERAKGNKAYYLESLSKQEDEGRRGEKGTLHDKALEQGYTVAEEGMGREPSWEAERRAYERLCRGDVRRNPIISAKFKCYYQKGSHPFLRIGPLKTEVVHINPTIYIYYDVLYDSEIEVIKEMAMPRFQRATVQNHKTGELETASYRISKSAWLKDLDHEVVARVNRRIHHATGLEMSTAEELQIANYGVGGHYEPHFDHAREEEREAFKSLGTGNRIATFLFYMSNVTGGGATVFPRIETALWPQKGSAAFWHNLHPSGDGDSLTRHAACPVLVGEKWVSNKWIHERGQEFIRRCGLSQDQL